MLHKIANIRELVRNILSKRNYFILFACASILLFFILYILTLATTTNQSLTIFVMMNGISYTIATFLMLALVAILFGIYIILLVFSIRLIRLKLRNKNARVSRVFGAGGFIVGLFSAGCPMCGAFLFGLFGAPLALFFMPFKGLELRALAIVLLFFSVYLIGRNLIKCRIKQNN